MDEQISSMEEICYEDFYEKSPRDEGPYIEVPLDEDLYEKSPRDEGPYIEVPLDEDLYEKSPRDEGPYIEVPPDENLYEDLSSYKTSYHPPIIHQTLDTCVNNDVDDYQAFNKHRVLSKLLQKLCSSNKPHIEIDTKATANIFYEMGNLYRHQSPNMLSLIRAAALFNAAIVRKPTLTHQIKESLHELCNHIQEVAGCDRKEDLVEQANKVAKGVKSMRNKARDALKSLQKITDNLKSEEQRVEQMKQIQNGVTNDYKRIMANLCQFCENIMGRAPCHYALAGMGSLARKEITPYSDFEHVIILKEGCHLSRKKYNKILNYFRWYSVVFHVVIINLGETIIPSVAIPDLNDKASLMGDWFFDAYTKRGISFDGMMAHACKFPLGFQEAADERFTTELIKPVSKMLEYLNSEDSLKSGYHLADILTKTCFVFGDKGIYRDFDKGVKQKIRNAYKDECFNDIKVQLEEDLSNFAINTKALTELQSNVGFNVKRLVYRSTTLFISAWGRLEGIDCSSSFDIISALRIKNVISDYVKCKLMYAIALACEIRLRVYLNKDRQDDIYEPEARNENEEHSFVGVVGKSSLINYFQVAYALQVSICKKIRTDFSHLIADPIMLNIKVCSALGLEKITNDLSKVCITNTAANVDIYNIEDCLTYLEEGLRTNFKISLISLELSTHVADKETSQKIVAYRHNYYSKYLFQSGRFDEAFYFATESIKIMEFAAEETAIFHASCYELAGYCLVELKKYKLALLYFSKSLKIHSCMAVNTTNCLDKSFALIQYYTGICYEKIDLFTKATQCFYKALPDYENETPDKQTAAICFHLGVCLTYQGEYTLSYMYLKKSLQIYKKLPRSSDFNNEIAEALKLLVTSYKMKSLKFKETKDICDFRITFQEYSQILDDIFTEKKIALIFLDIGNNLMDLELLNLSYFWLQKSLTTYTTLTYHLGDDRSHGKILLSIGLCLMKMNKHKHSLKYLTGALKVYEKTSLEITADDDVAETFRNIGLCFLAMKETSKAHVNLKKALKVYETISVDVETDKNFAKVLDDIGVCLMEMRDYETSLECLEKSLHIKKNVPWYDFCNDDVALTFNNIGICLMKLNKHTESLQSFKKALKIQKITRTTTFGIICTINNIGLCAMAMNKFGESLSYFRRAKLYCKEVFADGNSLTQIAWRHMADTLNNLGSCHLKKKEYKLSLDAFSEALEYYCSLSSSAETNAMLFYVLKNIGLCFMRLQSYESSLEYFKQSLDLFECDASIQWNVYPVGDETTLSIAALHNNIGLCLLHTNRVDESIPCLRKSIDLYQSVASSNDEDVATVLRNIAIAYMNKGRCNDCFKCLNDALILYQKTSVDPETDESIAKHLTIIGNCRKLMGLFEEALSYFERALKIMRRVSSNEADDKRVLRTLFECGSCRLQLGRYESLPIDKVYLEMTLKCIGDILTPAASNAYMNENNEEIYYEYLPKEGEYSMY